MDVLLSLSVGHKTIICVLCFAPAGHCSNYCILLQSSTPNVGGGHYYNH
jgi:hypothetical protein